MFSISSTELNRDQLIHSLSENKAGAIVVFEGWVRNHNEGKSVSSLEYQIYHELALKEGSKILEEAKTKFNLHTALAVHREGHLKLGEVAVWIGATASHRDDAFRATRYIIDEIKHRLPVWKKEHYTNQKPEWVFCKHHHHHVHFSEAEYYQKQGKVADQAKLKNAKVLVIGAGGLGCPALTTLASAGVGTIGICDFDTISISNIHRQFLYSPNLVGEKKVEIAAKKLQELNPFIKIVTHDLYFDLSHAQIIKEYDLVLDCTDNMKAKYLIHDVCFSYSKTLICAGIYKNDAQLRTFIPKKSEGCLRCQVEMAPKDSLLGNCNDFGVVSSTTNVVGSLQASEALVYLQKNSNNTTSHTIYLNLETLTQLRIKNYKKQDCPTCDGHVDFVEDDFEITSGDLNSDFLYLDIRNMQDHELEPYKTFPQKIALSCHRGVRSLALVEKLRSEGHDHFYSVKGGACNH